MQHAGLHKNGGDSAAAAVYARLDNHALRELADIRLEFADLGDDGKVVQKVIHAVARKRGYG